MNNMTAIEKELNECLKDNTELMCNDAYIVTKDNNRISFLTDDEIIPLVKKCSDNFDHIDFILSYQPYEESFEDTKKVYINTKEKITKLNNQKFKYWNVHYDLDKMTNDDNTGWQFLCTQTISLKNPQPKGDDKMFEDLIARVRVYKAKGDKPHQHRPYELTLISDKTEVFENINQNNDRNNISKANFIFHHLSANGVDEDEFDGSESDYNNIKEIEAIILANRDLHIAYHNLQYEPNYRGRDGWEICGIDLTRVIMYKFTLTNNTIIRFDFSGMIDNEEGTQGVYFQDIIDKNAELNEQYKKEKETKKLVEEIKNEQDTIIELSASPVYERPSNKFFSEGCDLQPKGDFAYMVEFFSDLIVDEDTIYQGSFGVNSRYIKDAMKLITEVESRAKEIADKYADKGVKVTVNGLNDGCEKGMAVYVWIPYQ